MDSGKLVETAVHDLGVTAGPWPLEYDGSLAIGGQVAISPANIGPDDVGLDERKANLRLFSWSRELYGKVDQLTWILEALIKGKRLDPLTLEVATAEARLLLAAPKKGGGR